MTTDLTLVTDETPVDREPDILHAIRVAPDGETHLAEVCELAEVGLYFVAQSDGIARFVPWANVYEVKFHEVGA